MSFMSAKSAMKTICEICNCNVVCMCRKTQEVNLIIDVAESGYTYEENERHFSARYEFPKEESSDDVFVLERANGMPKLMEKCLDKCAKKLVSKCEKKLVDELVMDELVLDVETVKSETKDEAESGQYRSLMEEMSVRVHANSMKMNALKISRRARAAKQARDQQIKLEAFNQKCEAFVKTLEAKNKARKTVLNILSGLTSGDQLIAPMGVAHLITDYAGAITMRQCVGDKMTHLVVSTLVRV